MINKILIKIYIQFLRNLYKNKKTMNKLIKPYIDQVKKDFKILMALIFKVQTKIKLKKLMIKQ